MNDVERLIDHLLTKDFSIASVRSIVEELKIDRDELMKILDDRRFADFFQLLRPSKNSSDKIDKVALTFDVSSILQIFRLNFLFSFSFSVAHITVINVKMTNVHFFIFVLFTFDR